jgi:heterodisulfide reductase subunit A
MSDKNNTSPKVGVYVCHCGGNISDHVEWKRWCGQPASCPGSL